ncbi:60S ribosomal protein L9B [Tilletia horrida]|uniref:60S ribosomal protein L9B n=1 Tax=Tilletia horrida TaxID=155126 RepID=A0AAN6JKC3_9BASI|nr:60S ribosomal protein L9B [Tilletia horrida]
MLQLYKDLDLEIPEGVEVTLHSRMATVKGPRGELTKVRISAGLGLRHMWASGGSGCGRLWNMRDSHSGCGAQSNGQRFSSAADVRHMQMDIRLIKGPKGQKLKFIVWHGGRKHVACLRTAKAVFANMITGVTVGFQYKMRAVYAHFPINIIVAGDGRSAEIRNFLGEKRVRNVQMRKGVTISEDKAQKDQVLVEGNDIEEVSQSAADLHGQCLVKNKDIRKFLDGIYCSAKGPIVQAEN